MSAAAAADEPLERVRAAVLAAAPPAAAGARAPERFLGPGPERERFREAGESLLRAGKVAVVMAAGGLSTRMGAFRGLLSVGPVTGCSLFRLQGERVLALRACYGAALPWLVMTSEPVHAATTEAFAREGLGGAARFVRQPLLPVVDAELRPVHLLDDGPLLAPTGHGGLVAALAASGALDELAAGGCEHLFFFQYPNVLERVCDPAMLGYHLDQGHDATLKGFGEYAPDESVGRVVETAEGLRVREYYYARGELAAGRPPGNTNTFVFSMDFLRRCVAAAVPLPWHGVPMRLPGDPRPYWRAEQFLFDLLPYARRAGLVMVERASGYAPLKQPQGPDSPDVARAALAREHRRWLEAAGAVLPPAATVEIRPSFALDAVETALRVTPGQVFEDGTVLS